MGSILVRILGALLLLAIIVCAVGWFLPRGYRAEVEREIDAPPGRVFRYINTIGQWPKWSSWSEERIKGLKVEFSGAEKGAGARMNWDDPRPDARFDGYAEITSSDPQSRVEYSIRMGQVPMDGYFEVISRGEDKTTLRWVASGKLPDGIAYGYFGLTYGGFLKTELNRSLDRLESAVE